MYLVQPVFTHWLKVGAADMKKCIRCEIQLTQNNTTNYRLKNYIYKCNECIRSEKKEYARKFFENNPDRCRDRSRVHKARLRANSPVKYSCHQMRSSASKRAKAFDLPFDITSDYLISIAPEFCPVMGYKLAYGGGDKTKASPSLDRINPKKGYIVGNVQVLSLIANTMKNEATVEELNSFANWVNSGFSTQPQVKSKI